MKEILNYYKKFGEAQKFRSNIGKCLIQDRGQKIFREWVGFQITRWVGGVKKG